MYFIICRQYRSMCLWEIESIQLLSLIQSDSISPGTRLYRDVPKGRTYKLASLLDRTECYTHIRYYWWILNEWKQYLNLIGTASQTSWITECLCLNSKIAKNDRLCYDDLVEIWASSRLTRVKLVQYFTVCIDRQKRKRNTMPSGRRYETWRSREF